MTSTPSVPSRAGSVAIGERGAVAAKHALAAQAAIEMLDLGGNAVDAAVAAAFVIGVAEPWMSGIGGVGYLVIRPQGRRSAYVVDGGARAPRAAHEHMYRLGDGRSEGLFPWRSVVGDENHQGWRSVAVPGSVASLAMALERFGRFELPTVLRPAIRAAAEGVPVTWNTTLRIALDASVLAAYPETALTFMPDGHPIRPAPSQERPASLMSQPELASTLERLARYGPRDFYEGETARRVVAAVRAGGGMLDEADLASFRATITAALETTYRGHWIATVPGATGGAWLVRVLQVLDAKESASFGTAEYLDRFVHACRLAFAERYACDTTMTEDTTSARMTEPLGTSTTHIAVVDNEGCLVSCTQTLVSAFGSRATVAGTGILLNNAMYWFDPEPGHANSVGPSKRPLSNVAPVVAEASVGFPRFAIGSSGGRRILCANAQILLGLIDGELGLADALAAPRVDASGERLLADSRIPASTVAELTQRGHDILQVDESVYPQHFGSPAAVAAYPDGRRVAAVDPLLLAGALAQGRVQP